MLRDYQIKALDEIRTCYGRGVRKVLLHMATGGGKTAAFCEVLKLAHQKGTACLVVVRGRKLIAQASARLDREGVPHDIIMAGSTRRTFENIRVCSIDTLHRRGHAPEASLIVIDEAHQTSGDGYKWFLAQYPHARILGVTATPHLKRGMRHIADAVVRPITASELTEQGYLVPLRYWTPEAPDLSDVKTIGDDYNQKELGKAMRKAALSGNIVKTYLEKGNGRRAVLFAVDIEHSRLLVEQFRCEGICADHIDATCTDEQRDQAITRLEKKEISVLSNVGVLTTGVDIPPIELIIMARPTKSYNLWIQMIGRGTRPCPEVEKSDCHIFDHAGNVAKHGLLEDERECHLDGKPPGDAPQVKQCMACYAWNGHFASACSACGAPFEEQKKPQRNKDTDENVDLQLYAVPNWHEELNRLIIMGKSAGYKPGFVFHRMKAIYGEDVAKMAMKLLRKREPQWAAIKAKSIPLW